MSWLTYDWFDVSESWCVLEVDRLDACDPFSVVHHVWLLAVVPARLDEGVEDDVAVEVDDRDPRQHLALVSQHSLAVERQDLRLSIKTRSIFE